MKPYYSELTTILLSSLLFYIKSTYAISDILPTGKFTGVVTTSDGRSHQMSVITNEDEESIRTHNLNMKCGNNNPISPLSFEEGRLEYIMNFDYGSYFDRKYMTNCMSPANVVLEHDHGEFWNYTFSINGEVTAGTLTFQCTKECEDQSKCNSIYEDEKDTFGMCEVLESFDSWNELVNNGATCPISNLESAEEIDTGVTIVEISRTLITTVCEYDTNACSTDTIDDELPSLTLNGQEVLVAPSPSENDNTEMTIQRQGNLVTLSYTYYHGGELQCMTETLSIGNSIAKEILVSTMYDSVCADFVCFGDITYSLSYHIKARSDRSFGSSVEQDTLGNTSIPTVMHSDAPSIKSSLRPFQIMLVLHAIQMVW